MLMMAMVGLAAVGCSLVGRYVGVPGGSGVFEWQVDGQAVGRIHFWPGDRITGDFKPFSDYGGTWSLAGGRMLVVSSGGPDGKRWVFSEVEPDVFVVARGGRGIKLVLPE